MLFIYKHYTSHNTLVWQLKNYKGMVIGHYMEKLLKTNKYFWHIPTSDNYTKYKQHSSYLCTYISLSLTIQEMTHHTLFIFSFFFSFFFKKYTMIYSLQPPYKLHTCRKCAQITCVTQRNRMPLTCWWRFSVLSTRSSIFSPLSKTCIKI